MQLWSWVLGDGGHFLADMEKGGLFPVEEHKAQKSEIKEDIGNLPNCTLPSVMRAQGVWQGDNWTRTPWSKPAGTGAPPHRVCIASCRQWGNFDGFQLGSDMVGLTLGRNILAAARRMENERGHRRILGNSRERRCEMAEALFPWAKECKLRSCYLERKLVPRVAPMGRKGWGQ